MARLFLVACLLVAASAAVLAEDAAACGLPAIKPILTNGESRIRGGREVRKHSYPWQARVGIKIPILGAAFMCGGTIIDEYHVLCAAHCFMQSFGSFAKTIVRLGDHHATQKDEGEIDYEVEKVMSHEGFAMANDIKNDIAVLRLKKKFVFTANIQAACLPTVDSDVMTGRTCVVTGWGSTVNQTTGVNRRTSPVIEAMNAFDRAPQPIMKPSNVLKQAVLTIMPRDVCRQVWGPELILDQMICTWNDAATHEPCQGDSGGPMACLNADGESWTVEGVVSFGAGCGMNGPAVFTRVSTFLSWIAEKTKMTQ